MLAAWVKDFEVVVVNDGSTDRTGAIVSAIMEAEPRVRLVTHARNQGYGSTLAHGFAAATKELTFFMDSDGQFDIRDLARLLPFIDEFDAVIGYRLIARTRGCANSTPGAGTPSSGMSWAYTRAISIAPSNSCAPIFCINTHSKRGER